MNNVDSIQLVSKKIFEKAIDAKRALEQFEAIGNMASKINETEFKFYFGFTQKVMLDFSIVKLCALYDNSSKRYKKNTMFELINYIEENKNFVDYNIIHHSYNNSCKYLWELDDQNLEKKDLEGFLSIIRNIVDDYVKNNVDFKKIQDYRDKYVAHSEQVLVKISELPSLESINKLISIAENLSICVYERLFESQMWVSSTIFDLSSTIMLLFFGKNRMYLQT